MLQPAPEVGHDPVVLSVPLRCCPKLSSVMLLKLSKQASPLPPPRLCMEAGCGAGGDRARSYVASWDSHHVGGQLPSKVMVRRPTAFASSQECPHDFHLKGLAPLLFFLARLRLVLSLFALALHHTMSLLRSLFVCLVFFPLPRLPRILFSTHVLLLRLPRVGNRGCFSTAPGLLFLSLVAGSLGMSFQR